MSEQRPAWRVNSGMLARLTGTFRAQNPASMEAHYSDAEPVLPIADFQQIRQLIYLACCQAFNVQQPISLLVITVDEFESFERNYGKDAALKAARFIEETLCHHRDLIFGKETGIVIGRYVENRYLLLLPGLSGALACEYAEYVRRAVASNEFIWNFRPLCFTVSIGVSHKPGHNGDHDMLIMHADQACDQIVACGGNRVAAAKSSNPF